MRLGWLQFRIILFFHTTSLQPDTPFLTSNYGDGMEFDKNKELFLKQYIEYKIRTDPNTRSFLKNGTVRMGKKRYHQYFFFSPGCADCSAELANAVMLQHDAVEQVYTEKNRAGVRIRVGFVSDRKPENFEKTLKRLEPKYGELLTYRDCKF